MKLAWEWQFRFIEARMLKINHSFPNSWWNSVFSKGISVQWCEGLHYWKDFYSFYIKSMKEHVEHKTAAHHRSVRLISVRGAINRHHQKQSVVSPRKPSVLERKQELFVMSILFVSLRIHILVEIGWGSLYFLNSNFMTIYLLSPHPCKYSHHSRPNPHSIIPWKRKLDIILHCYQTI